MTPTASATPVSGEEASPDSAVLFPAASGLVVGAEGIVAPTLTQLVMWGSGGDVVQRRALAEVGIDAWESHGASAWALRNGMFVVGGGESYTWAAAGFEPWEAKGQGMVEHEDGAPSDSTVPRTKYQWPERVATDGSLVAASFVDGTVRVFEVGGRLLHEFQPVGLAAGAGAKPLGLQYLPGDVLLVWGLDVECPVQAWKPDGSELVRRVADGPTTPVHVALAPEGARLLVTALDRAKGKMPWWLLDSPTLELQHRGELPTPASAVALGPDGELVAGAAGPDAANPLQVTVTNLADGTAHSFRREGYVAQSLAFSQDGKVLYTHNAKAGIVAWDADSGKELQQFGLP